MSADSTVKDHGQEAADSKTEIHEDRRSSTWDVNNAKTNYSALLIAQIGIAFASFASVWLVTQSIGSEGYGGLISLIAASQIVQISLMWTCTALGRFGVEEFVRTGKIFATFWARSLIFVINLIVVLGLSPLWLPALGSLFKVGVETHYFILAHISALALTMHVQFALQAVKKLRVFAYLQFIERIVSLCTLSILWQIGSSSIESTFAAYIAPMVATSLIGIYLLLPYINRFPEFDIELVRRILRYSLPLPLYSLLSFISFNYFDAFFIIRYMTVTDLGIYSLAYQINGLLLQLPAISGSLLLPFFVSASVDSDGSNVYRKYLREIVPLLTIGFGLITMAVAIVAHLALTVVFGSGFSDSAELLWVFGAAATVTIPVASGLLPISNATDQTRVQLYAALVAATLNISLNFYLIPRYGLIGCAWATYISFACSTLVFAIILDRKLQISTKLAIAATAPALAGAIVFTTSREVVLTSIVIVSLTMLFIVANRNIVVSAFRRFRGV